MLAIGTILPSKGALTTVLKQSALGSPSSESLSRFSESSVRLRVGIGQFTEPETHLEP